MKQIYRIMSFCICLVMFLGLFAGLTLPASAGNELPIIPVPTDPCKNGHDWGDPTYTWSSDNSTCTAKRVCKRNSNHVETETEQTTMDVTTPASCLSAGTTVFRAVFQNSAFIEQTKYVSLPAALGHDFGAWTQTIAPTCTEPGEETRECSRCDAFETRPVNAPGHDWDDGVYHDATYGTAGCTRYTCTVCGYSYDAVDANAPAAATVKEYKLASELKDGDKVVIVLADQNLAISSSASGSKLSGMSVTPANSKLDNADEGIVFDVTIDSDGYITFTNGGKYLTSGATGSSLTLADSASDYSLWTLEAATGGFYVKNVNAGQYLEYDGSFTAYGLNTNDAANFAFNFYALDTKPIISKVSLTAESDVLLNLYLELPAGLTEDNADLTVKLYDGSTELKTIAVTSEILKANGYRFQIAEPARDMHKKVTLKLFDGDEELSIFTVGGKKYDENNPLQYCVQDYLETMLIDPAISAELRAVCEAMSDYGHYAQLQQNWDTEHLTALKQPTWINAVTVESLKPDDAARLYDKITVEGNDTNTNLKFVGTSLIMESEMILRFYFTYQGEGTPKETNGTPLGHLANSEYYYWDVKNIAAREFGDAQSVVVTDGTETVSVSGFSVHTYVEDTLYRLGNQIESGSNNEKLANVVKAIVIYGQKAAEFFATLPQS